MLAELHARWERENKIAEENSIARVYTITTTSNAHGSHVSKPPTINGKIIGVGNVSTTAAKHLKLSENIETIPNKSVDSNNVPLASFVAQEEHVDVNFIKNTAYRNNFGNNNYKPYPSNSGNGYRNSYGNSYNNNRSVHFELEVMLKYFISTQTAFNKSVEEKLVKINVLASKVDKLALDVDLLKMKVMPNDVKYNIQNLFYCQCYPS